MAHGRWLRNEATRSLESHRSLRLCFSSATAVTMTPPHISTPSKHFPRDRTKTLEQWIDERSPGTALWKSNLWWESLFEESEIRHTGIGNVTFDICASYILFEVSSSCPSPALPSSFYCSSLFDSARHGRIRLYGLRKIPRYSSRTSTATLRSLPNSTTDSYIICRTRTSTL